MPGREDDPRFEPCVKCGRCLSVCPVFLATAREELSPRAKAGLFEKVLAGVEGVDEGRVVELAARCVGCGRCQGACPLGRSPLAMVRSLNRRRPSFAKALAARVLGPGRGPGGLARRALGKAASTVVPRSGVKPMVRAAGRTGLPPVAEAAFFPGCAALLLRPEWAKTGRALLDAAGVRLLDAEFACCGFPKSQAGLAGEAAADASANVDAWRRAGRPVVAVPCATCLAGLAGYAENEGLFRNGEEREAWNRSLAPLSRFLANLEFSSPPESAGRIMYHRPCHETRPDDFELVSRMFPGRTAKGPDACCGFGGLARLSSPGLADAVARDYWDGAAPEAGTVALTGCTGCALSLGRSAPEGAAAGHWLDAVSAG